MSIVGTTLEFDAVFMRKSLNLLPENRGHPRQEDLASPTQTAGISIYFSRHLAHPSTCQARGWRCGTRVGTIGDL